MRWRLIDLAQWVWDEFEIAISKQTLSRELRAIEYRKLSAQTRHHAQDDDAIPTCKKTSPPRWQRAGHASRAARR
ncbi:helix-turn-helix domain-containing protein [Sphingomonas sp. UYP23]